MQIKHLSARRRPSNKKKQKRESYKFSPGDLIQPAFPRERKPMRQWIVVENYVSVRDSACVKCVDTVEGEWGYFLECEMALVAPHSPE